MEQTKIFLPMAALAALTFAVLLLVPFQRFRAAFRGKVTAADFKVGESSRVPAEASIPNRNYMNLLEVPMLFYVVCLGLFVTKSVDSIALGLAWAYVALRMIHSGVHLTYNNVFHRLSFFAASNVLLVVIWVRWILSLS